MIKKKIIVTLAAAMVLCSCLKEDEEKDSEPSASSAVSAFTTVPDDMLPEIKYSEKATYRIGEESHSKQTGALSADVIEPDDGENIYWRAADGSEDPVILERDDKFLFWNMDSCVLFANDAGAFQARFSCEPYEFEGKLTIHISEVRDEPEISFIPSDLSIFPKADTDGRMLWFAADNFDETLEMLGISEEDFTHEQTYNVVLTSDRIYFNNLPLDDVRNLIHVNEIRITDGN